MEDQQKSPPANFKKPKSQKSKKPKHQSGSRPISPPKTPTPVAIEIQFPLSSPPRLISPIPSTPKYTPVTDEDLSNDPVLQMMFKNLESSIESQMQSINMYKSKVRDAHLPKTEEELRQLRTEAAEKELQKQDESRPSSSQHPSSNDKFEPVKPKNRPIDNFKIPKRIQKEDKVKIAEPEKSGEHKVTFKLPYRTGSLALKKQEEVSPKKTFRSPSKSQSSSSKSESSSSRKREEVTPKRTSRSPHKSQRRESFSNSSSSSSKSQRKDDASSSKSGSSSSRRHDEVTPKRTSSSSSNSHNSEHSRYPKSRDVTEKKRDRR